MCECECMQKRSYIGFKIVGIEQLIKFTRFERKGSKITGALRLCASMQVCTCTIEKLKIPVEKPGEIVKID